MTILTIFAMSSFSFAAPTFSTGDFSRLLSAARPLSRRPLSSSSQNKKYEVFRPSKAMSRMSTTVTYGLFGAKVSLFHLERKYMHPYALLSVRFPEHLAEIVLNLQDRKASTRKYVLEAYWLDSEFVSEKLKQGLVANTRKCILETFLLGSMPISIKSYQEYHVFTGESALETILKGAISISTQIYEDCIGRWYFVYKWDRDCMFIQLPKQLESWLTEQEEVLIRSDAYRRGWWQPKRTILVSDHCSRNPEISREESRSTCRGDPITQESILTTTTKHWSGSAGIWVWKQDQGRKKDWRIRPLICSRAVTQEMFEGQKLDQIGYCWNSSRTQLPMAYLMGDMCFREIRRSVRCKPPKRTDKENKRHQTKRLTTKSYMTERHVKFCTAS